MRSAFIDTSALAAVLFKETSFSIVQSTLADLESVYASNLLEAEIRAAAARESVLQQEVDNVLSKVTWIFPDRSLSHELRVVVSAGVPLKGADLWHVACALYLAGDPSLLPFVTLDETQSLAASRMGFKVLPAALPYSSGAYEPPATYKRGKPKPRKGKSKE